MAHSSILGADRAAPIPRGHDLGALGPSDTSDSGSDIQGHLDFDETDQDLADLRTPLSVSDDRLRDEMQGADSDATSTGERATAVLGEDLRDAGDIAPDRVINSLDELGAEAVSEEDFDEAFRDDEDAQPIQTRGKRNVQPADKPERAGNSEDGPLDCAEWMDDSDD